MSAAQSLRNARHRDRKVARGVCMDCTQPRVPGHKRCQRHIDANREHMRNYHARNGGVIRMLALGPRKPTIRARHKNLTPAVNVTPPPGWSVEADIREELIALGEIVALRKVG